jgi:hypothetical protein
LPFRNTWVHAQFCLWGTYFVLLNLCNVLKFVVCLFLLVIVLSALGFRDSDRPFGIFKTFLILTAWNTGNVYLYQNSWWKSIHKAWKHRKSIFISNLGCKCVLTALNIGSVYLYQISNGNIY